MGYWKIVNGALVFVMAATPTLEALSSQPPLLEKQAYERWIYYLSDEHFPEQQYPQPPSYSVRPVVSTASGLTTASGLAI